MTRVAPVLVLTDRSPALEDAPDRAAAVAANALVDQLGRLELKPLDTGAEGLVDTCVKEYSGVSVGESRKR